ncbi:hypothetical protein [Bacteroides cellulosilyticus]|uniref:hypothetical protein n=1 Tax=Bacteroides cellulosilyticus TaxID=246787 RepID=UPI0032C0515F
MIRRVLAIKTLRGYKHMSPSYKSVFEWEDIIAHEMGMKLFWVKRWVSVNKARIDKRKLTEIYHLLLPRKKRIFLFFDMIAIPTRRCVLDVNTIPVIIDFWLSKDELHRFYNAYKHCPLVLITSLEVYEFLIDNACPLNIEHCPLSLPDSVDIKYDEKLYDFCFIGRKDPFFVEFVKRYSEEHPDFIYVVNNDDINHRKYYTNKGDFIGADAGRETYLNIIRRSKICTYTTPGFDKAKKQSDFFNQVTPRVLEMLSGGCYILGHYPDNLETNFYELKSMVPQIKNYADFEYYMDLYRNSPNRNIEDCRAYLSKHNTSSRIPILKRILKKHGIQY